MAGAQAAIGFLTIEENPAWGFLGGLLVLNQNGRPLEFHCTAPIKPSRSQEILYGTSLRGYLSSDLIGGTLLAKTKLPLLFLCCNDLSALQLREQTEFPVVSTAAPIAEQLEQYLSLKLSKNEVWLAASCEGDVAALQTCWNNSLHHWNLTEPFERVREALEEARKSARPAAPSASPATSAAA